MNTNLQEKIKKYAGAIARGSISQIPGIGSFAVELLNVTIPNQRMERIEKLLNLLSQQVLNISEEELKNKFNSTDFIDIFEDVLRQSVRATSDIRLQYLASVLKNGIDTKEIDLLQDKRLLEILEQINDIEVVLLRSYSLRKNSLDYQSFINKYSDILQLEEQQKLFSRYSKALYENKKVFIRHYKNNLIVLGLVGIDQENTLLPTRLGINLLRLIGFNQLSLDSPFVGEVVPTAEPIGALDVYQNLINTSTNIHSSIQEAKEEALANAIIF